ncbi:DUF5367 family protein [Paenibacillus sp. MDMC362]|uniref:DUF5367 family protein n=1 Tax=Paenibacillus sp. MDMC362 TaxID=2977365 RepID=UPI000DC2B63D|nr:DUF5367 family protein [Paenibacillus sp. MDMC362]RAR41903.1 hypothetical protein DP091_21365 [Paenibacillus sp. MDMC362]
MNNTRTNIERHVFFLAWGFVLWLAATVIFHFWGDWLIDVRHPIRTAVSFIIAIPLIYGCIAPLFSSLGIPYSDRARLSIYIALPGMLLDILSLLFHPFVFPLIPVESIHVLIAWLFWAYSFIFLAGMRPIKLATRHHS